MQKNENSSEKVSAPDNARTEEELNAAFDNYDGCPTAGADLARHGLTRESTESIELSNLELQIIREKRKSIVQGYRVSRLLYQLEALRAQAQALADALRETRDELGLILPADSSKEVA